MAKQEKGERKSIAARRAAAIAEFHRLNAPGTVTRGLADLHRADGPSTPEGKKVMKENPALRNAFGRLGQVSKKIVNEIKLDKYGKRI